MFSDLLVDLVFFCFVCLLVELFLDWCGWCGLLVVVLWLCGFGLFVLNVGHWLMD